MPTTAIDTADVAPLVFGDETPEQRAALVADYMTRHLAILRDEREALERDAEAVAPVSPSDAAFLKAKKDNRLDVIAKMLGLASTMDLRRAAPKAANDNKPKASFTRTSTAALMAQTFSPIKWIIPDYVPEGLVLLAGKQKLGKTWMALDWGGDPFPPLDGLMSLCASCHNSKTARMDRGNSKGASRFKGCDVDGNPLDDEDGWWAAPAPPSPHPVGFAGPAIRPSGPWGYSRRELVIANDLQQGSERWV